MKRFVLFWSIMICLGLSMDISNAYAKNNEAVKVSKSTKLKESEKEELRKVFREEMLKEEQAKEKQEKQKKEAEEKERKKIRKQDLRFICIIIGFFLGGFLASSCFRH